LAQQRDHLPGELWANAGFFVLEIYESVRPTTSLFTRKRAPVLNVGLIIIFPPQAQIAVIGRRDFGCFQLLSVTDTERNIASFERVENVVGKPRFMSKLESGTHFLG